MRSHAGSITQVTGIALPIPDGCAASQMRLPAHEPSARSPAANQAPTDNAITHTSLLRIPVLSGQGNFSPYS